MTEKRRKDFELLVLPHLAAAFSLARWLLRHPQDAEDAVQESLLRAFKSFDGFAGGSSAAWLLAIVRNTCLTALERKKLHGKVILLHDVAAGLDAPRQIALPSLAPTQDAAMIAEEDRRAVHAAIATLPVQFREVIVLREFHEMSYREIADIVGTPVGTVMSRLARARDRLKARLSEPDKANQNGKRS